jgi:tRNA-dihydrouridine synthase A
LLYTEMVTTGAVIHGDRQRLLGFSGEEQPIAVQLGGSNPKDLAIAARICVEFGYGEINLNVGCPSDRVQEGRFGACLMAEPDLVADCVSAMKAAVKVPVTVKCRIGIDDQDPAIALTAMTAAVKAAGVDALIVHARKAWLKGLSPKENRDVPPLDYELVYRLKQDNPDLPIAINGGIKAPEEWAGHCDRLDGVMIGREAYQNPEILLAVDPMLFGEAAPVADGFEAIEAMAGYVEAQLASGVRLNAIARHMLGLFQGKPGARLYRRHLATESVKPGADLGVLFEAAGQVRRAMEAKAA